MYTKDIIRQAQLRITPSREMILRYITRSQKPVSVDDIRLYVQKNHHDVDDATIYRTVRSFVQKGIVHQIDFHEGKFRYETTDLPHHHHIVCMECGSVQDVEDCLKNTVEHSIEKKTGYKISSHTLEFFGTCKKCQRVKHF